MSWSVITSGTTMIASMKPILLSYEKRRLIVSDTKFAGQCLLNRFDYLNWKLRKDTERIVD